MKPLVAALLAAATLAFAPALGQDPETPLDHAVEAGMRDPGQRQTFYELYGQSPVFILAADEEPDQQGEVVQFRLNSSIYQGLPLVNVFDTEERARAFMESRDLSSRIVSLVGSATLTLLDGDFYLLLNPDTPYQKFFHPEEIVALRGGTGAFLERALPASQIEDLVSVAPSPASFANSLRTALEAQAEVVEAYVLLHPSASPDSASPSYLVALGVGDADVDAEALMRSVGDAVQGSIGDGDGGEPRFVDFMVAEQGALRGRLGGDAEPFYRR